MIVTKLRLLVASLLLCCFASNVDACSRVEGYIKLFSMWNKFLPDPVSRHMDVGLNFKGGRCRFQHQFGVGEYKMEWEGNSDDNRCFVTVDHKTKQVMVRLDGDVFGGKVIPEVMEADPKKSYSSQQTLWYNIDFSRSC
jgi:hypothetical protein